MLLRMMQDLLGFVAFIVLAMLGFGTALQAVVFPQLPFSSVTVARVFLRCMHVVQCCRSCERSSYFAVFGESFFDAFQAESECIGPWEFSSCGFSSQRQLPRTHLTACSIVAGAIPPGHLSTGDPGPRQPAHCHVQHHRLSPARAAPLTRRSTRAFRPTRPCTGASCTTVPFNPQACARHAAQSCLPSIACGRGCRARSHPSTWPGCCCAAHSDRGASACTGRPALWRPARIWPGSSASAPTATSLPFAPAPEHT